MITLRNYQKSDYPFVKEILQSANLLDETWDSEENFAGLVKQHADAIIVSTDGEKVVGSILLVPYGSKIVYLFRLSVKEEYREKGIGTQLIKKAETIAKARGIKEVGLYVNASDQKLKEFYRKREYRMADKPMSYHYLWKDLS